MNHEYTQRINEEHSRIFDKHALFTSTGAFPCVHESVQKNGAKCVYSGGSSRIENTAESTLNLNENSPSFEKANAA